MDAWADGLNYYLATHPQTKPQVLTRFEPWMALSFTEGSIGGDIERISLADLKTFYGQPDPAHARGTRHGAARAVGIERHRHRARPDRATATRCCSSTRTPASTSARKRR